MEKVKTFTKADNGKLSKVIYSNNAKIEIPINKDGSVKWYEDKLKDGAKRYEKVHS